ncbi:MAG: hypothetical protein HY957_09005 [Nitrospirae bacterium]|nr:hypothetical protein [Nitrospirota bacterium]
MGVMKNRFYTEIICERFCKYYKEGKEELHCGGYEFLRNNLTAHELKSLAGFLKCGDDIKNRIPSKNKNLTEFVCRRCDFFIGGCDFSENRLGPPCGGYILISKTISRQDG